MCVGGVPSCSGALWELPMPCVWNVYTLGSASELIIVAGHQAAEVGNTQVQRRRPLKANG